DEYRLLLAMHHIVSDGWSLGILLDEFSELYSAQLECREPQLKELPVQYRDYAAWQREWLTGETLEEQESYWITQLSGAPALLELPGDRPRPARQSFNGSAEQLLLPKSLAEEIRRLSRHREATGFMVLLAAWELLLSRYSGQDDIT